MPDIVLPAIAASPSDVILGQFAVAPTAGAGIGVANASASGNVSASGAAVGVSTAAAAADLVVTAAIAVGVAIATANTDYEETLAVGVGIANAAGAAHLVTGGSAQGVAIASAHGNGWAAGVAVGIAIASATAGGTPPTPPPSTAGQGGSGQHFAKEIKNPFANGRERKPGLFAKVGIIGPTEPVNSAINQHIAAYEARLRLATEQERIKQQALKDAAAAAEFAALMADDVAVVHAVASGHASTGGLTHSSAIAIPRARAGGHVEGCAMAGATWSTYTADTSRDEEELMAALASAGAFDD